MGPTSTRRGVAVASPRRRRNVGAAPLQQHHNWKLAVCYLHFSKMASFARSRLSAMAPFSCSAFDISLEQDMLLDQ